MSIFLPRTPPHKPARNHRGVALPAVRIGPGQTGVVVAGDVHSAYVQSPDPAPQVPLPDVYPYHRLGSYPALVRRGHVGAFVALCYWLEGRVPEHRDRIFHALQLVTPAAFRARLGGVRLGYAMVTSWDTSWDTPMTRARKAVLRYAMMFLFPRTFVLTGTSLFFARHLGGTYAA